MNFVNHTGTLPHQYKIVIAGNHELSFDWNFTNPFKASTERTKHTGAALIDQIPTLGLSKDSLTEAVKVSNIREYLTNCTYLQDSSIEINGIKIYGTPWFVFLTKFTNK